MPKKSSTLGAPETKPPQPSEPPPQRAQPPAAPPQPPPRPDAGASAQTRTTDPVGGLDVPLGGARAGGEIPPVDPATPPGSRAEADGEAVGVVVDMEQEREQRLLDENEEMLRQFWVQMNGFACGVMGYPLNADEQKHLAATITPLARKCAPYLEEPQGGWAWALPVFGGVTGMVGIYAPRVQAMRARKRQAPDEPPTRPPIDASEGASDNAASDKS